MQTVSRTNSGRRQKTASARTGRRRKDAGVELGKKEKKRMVQLVICASVFLVLVAAKIIFPQGIDNVKGNIMSMITQDVDYKAAFSSIGKAIGGESTVADAIGQFYIAVFKPNQKIIVSQETLGWQAEQDFLAVSAGNRAAVMSRRLDGVFDQPIKTEPEVTAEPAETPAETPSAALAEVTQLSATIEAEPAYAGPALPSGVSMKHEILGISYKTPLNGTLTSSFGYREHPVDGGEKFHYGMDIAADTGTCICAFADGKVVAVGESTSLGKYLEIEHGSGVTTLYAHCNKLCVSGGKSVKAGDKIAEVGDTGISTGPHLHFEVHLNGVYLNPAYYVSLG